MNRADKWFSFSILGILVASVLGVSLCVTLVAFKDQFESLKCLSGSECAVALTSNYASIGGIPLSVLGLIYYAGHLAAVMLLNPVKPWASRLFHIASMFSVAGLAFSLWLVSLLMFKLQVTCTWCIGSASLSALLVFFYMIGANLFAPSGAPRMMTKSALALVTVGLYISGLPFLVGAEEPGYERAALEKTHPSSWQTDECLLVGSPASPKSFCLVTDLECEHCLKLLSQILAGSGRNDSSVYLSFLPLRNVDHSRDASALAVAAGKHGALAAFTKMYLRVRPRSQGELVQVGVNCGLSSDSVIRALAPRSHERSIVAAQELQSRSVGIRTTPTIITWSRQGIKVTSEPNLRATLALGVQ